MKRPPGDVIDDGLSVFSECGGYMLVRRYQRLQAALPADVLARAAAADASPLRACAACGRPYGEHRVVVEAAPPVVALCSGELVTLAAAGGDGAGGC